MSNPATGKSADAASATPVPPSAPSSATSTVKVDQSTNPAALKKSTESTSAEPKTAIANPMMVGKVSTDRPNIPVTFEDVSKATHDIRGAVYVTPCARNPELSELTGCDLWLKVNSRRIRGRTPFSL